MRFLVDECTGSGVAQWLREREHDVFSVYDDGGGMRDDAILRMANSERRIIVTDGWDFGEMIFREGRPHCGVIFLRVRNNARSRKSRSLRVCFKITVFGWKGSLWWRRKPDQMGAPLRSTGHRTRLDR